MERATKLIVVVWACAAMGFELWYVGMGRPLQLFVVTAFVLSAVVAAFDRRMVSLVLAFTYVFPILTWYVHHRFVAQFGIVWLAPLLGAMLPSALRTSWHVPSPWRTALALWALVVTASSVIVAAREIDFHLPLLFVTGGMSNSVAGGLPGHMVEWVLYVALVHVVGILWFDWLFGQPTLDFHRVVIAPLALSAAVTTLVAAYQLVVDVTFWNPTVYGVMGRASGTLLDGNVSGTVGALWIGASLVWARSLGRWSGPVQLIGTVLGWTAVWASGSRTAFAGAVIITAFAMADALVSGTRRMSMAMGRVFVVGAGAAILLFVLASAQFTEMSPLRRFSDITPGRSSLTTRDLLLELWNRNGLGAQSVQMIADHPLFGVGVGSFHIMAPDYAAMSGAALANDNAQNWYRHQLAEFGLTGSIGWMAWVAGFAFYLFARRGRSAATPPGAWTMRGVLVAFGLISLFGMPAQNPSAALTFWTMAFGYVAVAGPPQKKQAALAQSIAAGIVVAVFVAGTLASARNELRVPMRARNIGWPYSYGLYPPRPDDLRPEHWTGKRAVAVIDAPTTSMVLTVSVGYRGYPGRPVDVKVWRDGELVFDEPVSGSNSVSKTVPVPHGGRRVLLETRVSRVFRPSDFGIDDQRELGVALTWEFTELADVAGGSESR